MGRDSAAGISRRQAIRKAAKVAVYSHCAKLSLLEWFRQGCPGWGIKPKSKPSRRYIGGDGTQASSRVSMGGGEG
jgi:hypothetical protein